MISRMWIVRERNKKDVVREDVSDMKHSRKMGCSKKQGQLELSPLNVTQAAGHKVRWKEETTTTKKKV